MLVVVVVVAVVAVVVAAGLAAKEDAGPVGDGVGVGAEIHLCMTVVAEYKRAPRVAGEYENSSNPSSECRKMEAVGSAHAGVGTLAVTAARALLEFEAKPYAVADIQVDRRSMDGWPVRWPATLQITLQITREMCALAFAVFAAGSA